MVRSTWQAFGADDEATRNYIYSGLDTLANKQLTVVGPIALKKPNPALDPLPHTPTDSALYEFPRIDKALQSYGISDLGIEFIDFVSTPSGGRA